MPVKNGLTAKIAAYVAANPGKTAIELGEALGFDHLSGLLTYVRAKGLIFSSGPRFWQRYYSTAEAAAQHHEAIARAAVEQRKAKERACHKRSNRVKTALRRLRSSGASVAESRRIVLGAPAPNRWAPPAGFVGTFAALGPGRYLDDEQAQAANEERKAA